jgi:protein ImuB
VHAGLAFTDARARVPKLNFEDIDRAADAAALKRLALWLVRYTPFTALDGRDGLMLETTGCAHLHGGEQAMAERLVAKLESQGLTARMGLAATPGAAHALARAAGDTAPLILETGREETSLAALPVATLRISEAAETLLRRFGLTRIGQLYGIDRKALARRFASRDMADQVVLRLDQALGLRMEPLSPLRPPPAHEARLNCPEPIATSEALAEGLRRLADALCADLAARGEGGRCFTLHAFRADGTASSVEVTAARAAREAKHITRLFHEKLDRIDPGFGIDMLLLEAQRVSAMTDTRQVLSGALAGQDVDLDALSGLADRLTARLGEGRVTVSEPVASHLPERCERNVPFAGDFPPKPEITPLAPRPLRLFDPPEPIKVIAEVPDGAPMRFVWRRITARVTRADGPERINPEWWRAFGPVAAAPRPKGTRADWLAPKLDPRADAGQIAKIRDELQREDGEIVRNLPRARDYYRVEDSEGRRYWLFRDGLFDDGRGGRPDWYIHGMFA